MSRILVALAVLFGLASLAACSPRSDASRNQSAPALDAQAEYRQARARLIAAQDRLFRESTPATDRQALARRLKIDPARVGAFTGVGNQPVAQQTGPICYPGGPCVCDSDQACNDIFSTVCRDPSTGGSCDILPNGGVICRCWPKKAA